MVSIRFFSFVLMFILVLIGESSTHSQVMDTILAANGTGLESARKNQTKLGKEASDAVPVAAEVWNSKLKGRKIMLKKALEKRTVAVEGSDEEERAKISGKVANGLNNQIGSSQEKFKNQDDRNILKTNFFSSASPEASTKPSVKLPITNQLCFRYSKSVSYKGSFDCSSRSPKLVPPESDSSSQKLQSQELLGAAKELMNFMNEDYQRPPTKPPIHNNEPLDEEQAVP